MKSVLAPCNPLSASPDYPGVILNHTIPSDEAFRLPQITRRSKPAGEFCRYTPETTTSVNTRLGVRCKE